MGLSYTERQALQARAAGLREEVSSLRAEQDGAVASLSQDMEDAALLREVTRLERQRDDALESRDRATVTAQDAAALMEEAAKLETVTTAVEDAGGKPAEATDTTDDTEAGAADPAVVTPPDETAPSEEPKLNGTTLSNGEGDK